MPWPVYSESFIRTSVNGTMIVYTVPEDKRAVVRCLTICNAGPAAAAVYVRVHGYLLVGAVIQASELRVWTDLLVVAYERETMDSLANGPSISVTLSGYVLDDHGPGNPPPVAEREFVYADQLPGVGTPDPPR